MELELRRRIDTLNSMLERVQQRMAKQFGRSQYCMLGNDREHNKWKQIKLDEPTLANQDDEGLKLLPTWLFLSEDLYSGLRRVHSVLFDRNQIGAKYQGNRGLLEEVLSTEEWERLHDTTMGDDNMCVIAALRIQAAWLERLKQEKEECKERNKKGEGNKGGLRGGQGKPNDQGSPRPSSGSGSNGTQQPRPQRQQSGVGSVPEANNSREQGQQPSVQDSGSDQGSGKESERSEGSEDGELPGDENESEDLEGSDDREDGEEGNEDTEELYEPVPEPNNDLDSYEAGLEAEEALQQAIDAARRLVNAQDQRSLEDAVEEFLSALERAIAASDRLDDMSAYDDLMEETGPSEVVRKAAELASQEVKDQAERLYSWGAEQSVLRKMNPKEAIELAKLMRTSTELQKIAELIGSNRVCIRKRKTRDRLAHGPTLRLGIEHGSNLNKMVNSQKLQMLVAPNLFKWNLLNKSLRQFKTRMQQVLERGTGVIWVDSSGSMWSGRPYTYSQVAKATCISIMEYFHDEGRHCVVGLFDHGVREVYEVPTNISEIDFLKLKIKVASNNYGGGTDFFAPIITGFEKIKESQYLEKADQVMITDGQCMLSDEQVKQIKELQDETKVTIQTILMPGGYAQQMQEFGPVDSIQTSINDANKIALGIIQRMDDPYGN